MESSATGLASRPIEYRRLAELSPVERPVHYTGGAGEAPRPDRATGSATSASGSAEADTVRVLVVDDQPDVLTTTVELFKLMGYEVFSASNGQDAVEILKRTPDLQVLFSDVVMPGMNGINLGREARRLIPGINVILASGFHGEAMGAAGADIGDFHFLVKPFRLADVARVLRK
jgi:CheY-like chemotaxis protein